MSRLDRVLATSPADLTEIAWIEVRRCREDTRTRRDGRPDGASGMARCERTVLVRVWERGRAGCHRTGVATVSELEAAVREALAQARLAPPPRFARPPRPAADALLAGIAIPPGALFDPEVAELDPPAARELARGWTERGESARLAWSDGQVTVAASDGRRRSARVTAASLEVACGAGPAGGRAAAAARSLDALDGAEVAARARRRVAGESLGEVPAGPLPLLLAPEAAAALLALLNRIAFSSTAFRDGSSPLCGHLGALWLDPAITLRDDGTDPRGLAFPFDLAGAFKAPVDLVRDGFAITPAVDEALAAELGRHATPHALSPEDSLPANLFLLPGGKSEEELAAAIGDGLWIGALGDLEVYAGREARGTRFRARAGGVRRIAGGAVTTEALPDLLWEDGLPEALARVRGLGDRPVVVLAGEPLLGGISAPALALDPSAPLRPAELIPRS